MLDLKKSIVLIKICENKSIHNIQVSRILVITIEVIVKFLSLSLFKQRLASFIKTVYQIYRLTFVADSFKTFSSFALVVVKYLLQIDSANLILDNSSTRFHTSYNK